VLYTDLAKVYHFVVTIPPTAGLLKERDSFITSRQIPALCSELVSQPTTVYVQSRYPVSITNPMQMWNPFLVQPTVLHS
jgi:hypothetical protein